MIVNEPCQRPPVLATFVLRRIDEPWNDDAGRRAHEAIPILVIPDVIGVAPLVQRAIQPVAVPESVDGTTTEGRADRHVAEDAVERFEEVLTQAPTGLDGQLSVVRNIGNAVNGSDFRVEEVTHEVVLRETSPAEFVERFQHRLGRLEARTTGTFTHSVVAAFLPGES